MSSMRWQKSIRALAAVILLLAFSSCVVLAHDVVSAQRQFQVVDAQQLATNTRDQATTTLSNDVEASLPRLPVDASPALLIIDVQNCFLPGGAIPVSGGNDIIPIINKIRERYYFRAIVRRLFLLFVQPFFLVFYGVERCTKVFFPHFNVCTD